MKEALCRQIKYRRSARGFTLIELMIVLVVVAILASIAYPSYTRYMIRTRRAAAAGCLSEYANYMERFYTTNLRYDQDTSGVKNPFATLDCNAQSAPYYSYDDTTPAPTATSYTVEAVPIGTQASDTQCGTLSLNQTGLRKISGTGTVPQCW